MHGGNKLRVLIFRADRDPNSSRYAERRERPDNYALTQQFLDNLAGALSRRPHRHYEICLGRNELDIHFLQLSGNEVHTPCIDLECAVEKLPVAQGGNSGRLRRRGRLKGKLYLQEIS